VNEQPLESLYRPEGVERRWQETWEAEGLYAAGAGRRRDESYVICVPPPNVTGELHIGHAMFVTIEDIMIRWHRMLGDPTLWVPGRDHAGIAGQLVVERELAAEGLTRHDLGREKFLERVWDCTASASATSCTGSGRRPTGTARSSRWTPVPRGRCGRRSCGSTSKG
jgi:valyl-tRNA synthetase